MYRIDLFRAVDGDPVFVKSIAHSPMRFEVARKKARSINLALGHKPDTGEEPVDGELYAEIVQL